VDPLARVRLVEVARAAGVHPGTASRALNPEARDGVSRQTVRRVEQAAKELGYVPNSMARGLRTSRTMVVALVVPDITNPLFPPIVRGAEHVLNAAGYTLVLTDTNNEAETERDQVRALRGRGVDGFIVATARWEDETLQELAEAEVPTVLVNRRNGAGSFPFVGSDDRHGVRLCVEELADLGHRSILHLAGPPNTSTAASRAAAFTQVAAERGLADVYTASADSYSEEAGEEAAAHALHEHPSFTAIVAASDVLALGAQAALAARGLRCPQDVSVTGYNDVDYVRKLTPPLTTVRVPLRREGELAAETLLGLLDGGSSVPTQLLLPVELMRRGTTAPAPAR